MTFDKHVFLRVSTGTRIDRITRSEYQVLTSEGQVLTSGGIGAKVDDPGAMITASARPHGLRGLRAPLGLAAPPMGAPPKLDALALILKTSALLRKLLIEPVMTAPEALLVRTEPLVHPRDARSLAWHALGEGLVALDPTPALGMQEL